MMYHGKLYGKLWNKYFETGKTSEDFDKMESRIKELEAEIEQLKQAKDVERSSDKCHIQNVNGCNLAICGGGDWADASVDYFVNLTNRTGEDLLNEFNESGGYHGNGEKWFRDWSIEKGYCRIPTEEELEVCWEL